MTTVGTWKVEGDYFEACNCTTVCPCIFLGDPSQGDCKLAIAWHIDKGQYGGAKLDGLNVAGIFYAPGNMVTGPKWKAALYLDERASREQADALGEIFSGKAGGFLANVAALIGEVVGVKSAPIKFEIDGKQRKVHIPAALDLEAECIAGADPNRESSVVNPSLYAGAGFDPIVARSTQYTFKDHKMEWDNRGKNAFYSRFAYSA